MAKNEITGDSLRSKIGDQIAYCAGWDAIFSKKPLIGENQPISGLAIKDGKNIDDFLKLRKIRLSGTDARTE